MNVKELMELLIECNPNTVVKIDGIDGVYEVVDAYEVNPTGYGLVVYIGAGEKE